MSWNGIIALSAILVFLGKLLDWGLRKAQKEELLKRLARIEEYIKTISFSGWVKAVAEKVLVAYEFMQEIILGNRGFRILQGYWKPVILFLVVGAILENFAKFQGFNVYGIFTPYFMCFMSGIIFFLLGKISNTLNNIFPYIFRLILLSSIFSSVALVFGANLSDQIGETYWFVESDGRDRFDKSSLLALVNIPFDFVTIIVSMFFLKMIVRAPKFVVPAAILDVVASLLLTLGLYVAIDYLSLLFDGTLNNSISNSVTWLLSITGIGDRTIGNEEHMLSPLLLTTLIPVVSYMGIILGIIFVLKPLTIASGYLCGLLSEKKNTPFMELATVIAMFITMLKSVMEWEIVASWLQNVLV